MCLHICSMIKLLAAGLQITALEFGCRCLRKIMTAASISCCRHTIFFFFWYIIFVSRSLS